MEADKLTPEQSLNVITEAIMAAKSRFEENGFMYVFWGGLIFLVAGAQFLLLQTDNHEINYYPYFVIPLGMIFTWWYHAKRKRGKSNQIAKIVSFIWIALSVNMVLLGFIFSASLGASLIPVILILNGIGNMLSGIAIRSQLLLWSGVGMNIAGLLSFQLAWEFQPLLLAIVALTAILLPGIILMRKNKQSHV